MVATCGGSTTARGRAARPSYATVTAETKNWAHGRRTQRCRHEAVAAAAVYGSPDPLPGNRPGAYVNAELRFTSYSSYE